MQKLWIGRRISLFKQKYTKKTGISLFLLKKTDIYNI